MKHNASRLLALLLAVVMLFTTLPAAAFAADDDEISVVVSLEGLTLGQGFYVEPEEYKLSEINDLLEAVGYGPYDAEDLTAGMAILAMLNDNELEYTMTGDWESSAYLSGIKDIDKIDDGILAIPAIIGEKGGPTTDSIDGNDDDYLGEFDYSSMAGWMCTVNDYMIDVGISQWKFASGVESGKCEDYGNTYVVRSQFTLWGYGADLGHSSFGASAYFDHANKDELYIAYARSKDATAKAAALEVMGDLTATQDDVDDALETLKDAESTGSTTDTPQDVSTVLNATLAQLAKTVTEPSFGTSGGEWTVLTLARGGYYKADDKYFSDYYDRIVETVNTTAPTVEPKNGALHKTKSTENSRLILALSAIGKDATAVGDWNLVAPYEDFTWITKQGINGPIYTLLALDSHNYQTTDTTIRQQCIDYILDRELTDGGWALSGTTSDPDITAMALQALVPYKSQTKVAAAAEKAFTALSEMQKTDGGFASWGSVNCESCAQVVVACATWGINPDTDSRFVKTGGSALDAMLAFYSAEDAGFKHVASGKVNNMATDQAAYALVAYNRLVKNQKSLYDMSDVTFAESSTGLKATLSLPQKVENLDGTTFNAVVSLSGWETGHKLMDCILTVPKCLEVTGVTMGDRIKGGAVSWNLEETGEATNKLRIAYLDTANGSTLSLSGSDFPAELLTIGFKLKEKQKDDVTSLTVALTGMTFKKSSDSSDASAQTVVNITGASATAQLVNGISFSVYTLYTGDGVDLIPTDKTAIAVTVTGVNRGASLTHNGSTRLLYNEALTQKLDVPTYLALVDSSTTPESLTDAAKYTISTTQNADTLVFGDSNGDGLINAQDALASVNLWLRKSGTPDNATILAMNVNADARLNTFDSLGIVESFVNSTDFAVVTKAAAALAPSTDTTTTTTA